MSLNQDILVTVDAVVFRNDVEGRYLLLIKRKNDPFKGMWAFPGGFVDANEDLPEACARELEEETGLEFKPGKLKQIGAFGKPGRDPRGRTVTVAYVAELSNTSQEIKAADDAAEAKWWPLSQLPEMAFDHLEILKQVEESV